MTTIASMLWRRLDATGHDACRLEQLSDGWRLDGAAVFREHGVPARLAYEMSCDRAWRTKEGRIQGWIGERSVDFEITRSDTGIWSLNGIHVRGLESYVDLDLGFTPATNLSQLRRIALAQGQAVDVPVVWFEITSDALTVLPQRYERRSETTYWYQSPTFDYEALLEVGPSCFVRRYPGLWEAEE